LPFFHSLVDLDELIMSWRHPGVQCASYIRLKVASCSGIMAHSRGFLPAFFPMTIFLHGDTGQLSLLLWQVWDNFSQILKFFIPSGHTDRRVKRSRMRML
jgi:DUF1365 family protein